MSFRHRLAFFLIATLAVIQALTILFAYFYLRHGIVETAKRELTSAAHVFVGQLALSSEGAAEDVKILSLDYALRQAIAQRDYETEISALRNHGRRVHAARMMLVDLEGRTVVDTGAPGSVGGEFGHNDLLNGAVQSDESTAIVAVEGKVYWIVVVPVRAPIPIAFIAAFIPVDDALLEKLRTMSASSRSIALATMSPVGGWIVAARSNGAPDSILHVARDPRMLDAVGLREDEGRGFLTLARRLETAGTSAPVVAVLGYPLDDALAPYWSMIWPMLGVLAASLLAALAGATLIVRTVSRPLEALARTARQIAAGNYAPPERLDQSGELGQLSEALSVMTRSIAEREADLTQAMASAEQARAEAERANHAKSHFLANMSHELRTPLNAIMGFAEMLHQQVLGPIGVARYREYAQDIDHSARRLLALVSRMLELAEIERGELTIQHEDIAPVAVLYQAASISRLMAEEAGVMLFIEADSSSRLRISGDAGKLRQAFASLVHNAIKFTPRGGRVTVGAQVTGRILKVWIEDSGVGIPDSDIAAITRPFHRLRSALDGLHQGAGLGLPYAKAIVELHGGSLEIESTPGEGTRVVVLLPGGRVARADAA
jgi:signal transduction histidine kinase